MRKLIFVVLGVLFLASAASAQDASRADVSFGYSYVRDVTDGINLHGGNFSGAGYFNRWLGVTGEFGAYRLSQSGVTGTVLTYMFGPRITGNRSNRVSPFAQALVGGNRVSAGGASTNGFAWDAGGGLDLGFSNKVAFRPQFDYVGFRVASTTVNSARVSFGVVFRF